MRQLLCVLLAALLLVACQKEVGFEGGTAPDPKASVRCTSCSYLPVCDSTQLSYIDSSAAGMDTIGSTLVILGDTVINGIKYTSVSPSAIFSQGLVYNCDGGNYRIYQQVPHLGLNIDSLLQSLGLPPGIITVPSHIQTTILKSGASAGATWSDTILKAAPFPLLTIVAKLDYKLEEKGIQRIVFGKTYSNVVHVSSKLNIAIPLMPLPFNVVVDYYFADSIGIIETRTTNNGTLQSLTRLFKYKIK